MCVRLCAAPCETNASAIDGSSSLLVVLEVEDDPN